MRCRDGFFRRRGQENVECLVGVFATTGVGIKKAIAEGEMSWYESMVNKLRWAKVLQADEEGGRAWN